MNGRASIRLERPWGSVCLTVSPNALERILVQANQVQDLRLLDRFLMVTPESKRGRRFHSHHHRIVDQTLQSTWATRIQQLMSIPDGTIIQISADAFARIECNSPDEPHIDQEVLRLADIRHIARIAALFHLANGIAPPHNRKRRDRAGNHPVFMG